MTRVFPAHRVHVNADMVEAFCPLPRIRGIRDSRRKRFLKPLMEPSDTSVCTIAHLRVIYKMSHGAQRRGQYCRSRVNIVDIYCCVCSRVRMLRTLQLITREATMKIYVARPASRDQGEKPPNGLQPRLRREN